MNNRMISDITEFIFMNDKIEKADIIFMPGGSHSEIPEKGAELYLNGYADKLMPSGRYGIKLGKFAGVKTKQKIYNKEYRTECEFYVDVLLKNGIPEEDIYCEDESEFTMQNAFFSRRVVDQNGLHIKKAIICCKSFHARRCFMLYKLAFPEAELLISPVDCHGITRDNWFKQEYGVDRVFGELARCGNQFVDEIKKYLEINKIKTK